MEKLLKYCTLFTSNETDAAAINKTAKKSFSHKGSNKLSRSALFFSVVALLLSAACDRNVGSGCGTWPMVSSKNDRSRNSMYKSDVRPANYKNNKQYTYYKKYN